MHRLRLLVLLAALSAGACSHRAEPTRTADPASARTTPAGAVVGYTGDAGEHAWVRDNIAAFGGTTRRRAQRAWPQSPRPKGSS